MSLEYLNAENRNIRNVLPIRRCCSFCRNSGHNIQTCNDTRLYNFEAFCLFHYRTTTVELFKNILLEYSTSSPIVVRAYSSRFCGTNIRANLLNCVNAITLRIRNIISLEPATASQTPEPQMPEAGRTVEVDQPSNHNLDHATASGQDMSTYYQDVGQFIDMILNLRRSYLLNEYVSNRKFDIEREIINCDNTEQCECNICYENQSKQEFVQLNCGHEFCKDCIKQSLKNVRTENPQCAFCRSEIRKLSISNNEIYNQFDELLS